MADGLLDPGSGSSTTLPAGVIDEPDRQRRGQLAAAGLGEQPAAEPGPQQVQLGFGHLAFQAEQQPVVEGTGVIEAVLVEDERLGQRADLEQPVPVGVVAGQAGYLEADDARLAHANVGHQTLEALPALGARPGPAQIVVDDHDLVAGHPRARARWRSPYCRSVDVVFSMTWRSVDWRTYR